MLLFILIFWEQYQTVKLDLPKGPFWAWTGSSSSRFRGTYRPSKVLPVSFPNQFWFWWTHFLQGGKSLAWNQTSFWFNSSTEPASDKAYTRLFIIKLQLITLDVFHKLRNDSLSNKVYFILSHFFHLGCLIQSCEYIYTYSCGKRKFTNQRESNQS